MVLVYEYSWEKITNIISCIIFQYLYDFLDSLITQQTSPAEAYRKFDELGSRHIELLRKLTKTVQESRQNQDDDQVKGAVNEYEEVLERWETWHSKHGPF